MGNTHPHGHNTRHHYLNSTSAPCAADPHLTLFTPIFGHPAHVQSFIHTAGFFYTIDNIYGTFLLQNWFSPVSKKITNNQLVALYGKERSPHWETLDVKATTTAPNPHQRGADFSDEDSDTDETTTPQLILKVQLKRDRREQRFLSGGWVEVINSYSNASSSNYAIPREIPFWTAQQVWIEKSDEFDIVVAPSAKAKDRDSNNNAPGRFPFLKMGFFQEYSTGLNAARNYATLYPEGIFLNSKRNKNYPLPLYGITMGKFWDPLPPVYNRTKPFKIPNNGNSDHTQPGLEPHQPTSTAHSLYSHFTYPHPFFVNVVPTEEYDFSQLAGLRHYNTIPAHHLSTTLILDVTSTLSISILSHFASSTSSLLAKGSIFALTNVPIYVIILNADVLDRRVLDNETISHVLSKLGFSLENIHLLSLPISPSFQRFAQTRPAYDYQASEAHVKAPPLVGKPGIKVLSERVWKEIYKLLFNLNHNYLYPSPVPPQPPQTAPLLNGHWDRIGTFLRPTVFTTRLIPPHRFPLDFYLGDSMSKLTQLSRQKWVTYQFTLAHSAKLGGGRDWHGNLPQDSTIDRNDPLWLVKGLEHQANYHWIRGQVSAFLGMIGRQQQLKSGRRGQEYTLCDQHSPNNSDNARYQSRITKNNAICIPLFTSKTMDNRISQTLFGEEARDWGTRRSLGFDDDQEPVQEQTTSENDNHNQITTTITTTNRDYVKNYLPHPIPHLTNPLPAQFPVNFVPALHNNKNPLPFELQHCCSRPLVGAINAEFYYDENNFAKMRLFNSNNDTSGLYNNRDNDNDDGNNDENNEVSPTALPDLRTHSLPSIFSTISRQLHGSIPSADAAKITTGRDSEIPDTDNAEYNHHILQHGLIKPLPVFVGDEPPRQEPHQESSSMTTITISTTPNDDDTPSSQSLLATMGLANQYEFESFLMWLSYVLISDQTNVLTDLTVPQPHSKWSQDLLDKALKSVYDMGIELGLTTEGENQIAKEEKEEEDVDEGEKEEDLNEDEEERVVAPFLDNKHTQKYLSATCVTVEYQLANLTKFDELVPRDGTLQGDIRVNDGKVVCEILDNITATAATNPHPTASSSPITLTPSTTRFIQLLTKSPLAPTTLIRDYIALTNTFHGLNCNESSAELSRWKPKNQDQVNAIQRSAFRSLTPSVLRHYWGMFGPYYPSSAIPATGSMFLPVPEGDPVIPIRFQLSQPTSPAKPFSQNNQPSQTRVGTLRSLLGAQRMTMAKTNTTGRTQVNNNPTVFAGTFTTTITSGPASSTALVTSAVHFGPSVPLPPGLKRHPPKVLPQPYANHELETPPLLGLLHDNATPVTYCHTRAHWIVDGSFLINDDDQNRKQTNNNDPEATTTHLIKSNTKGVYCPQQRVPILINNTYLHRGGDQTSFYPQTQPHILGLDFHYNPRNLNQNRGNYMTHPSSTGMSAEFAPLMWLYGVFIIPLVYVSKAVGKTPDPEGDDEKKIAGGDKRQVQTQQATIVGEPLAENSASSFDNSNSDNQEGAYPFGFIPPPIPSLCSRHDSFSQLYKLLRMDPSLPRGTSTSPYPSILNYNCPINWIVLVMNRVVGDLEPEQSHDLPKPLDLFEPITQSQYRYFHEHIPTLYKRQLISNVYAPESTFVNQDKLNTLWSVHVANIDSLMTTMAQCEDNAVNVRLKLYKDRAKMSG